MQYNVLSMTTQILKRPYGNITNLQKRYNIYIFNGIVNSNKCKKILSKLERLIFPITKLWSLK